MLTQLFIVAAVVVLIGLIIWSFAPTRGRRIICPNLNCGYQGPADKESRGSLLVGLLLCFFFLLPGLIYFIVRGGYRYRCPKCGMQIAADN